MDASLVLQQAQDAIQNQRYVAAYRLLWPLTAYDPIDPTAAQMLAQIEHIPEVADYRNAAAGVVLRRPLPLKDPEAGAGLAGKVVIAGALLMLIGSGMPWARWEQNGVADTIYGFQAGGILIGFAVLLIVLGAIGLLNYARTFTRGFIVATAALTGLIVLGQIRSLNTLASLNAKLQSLDSLLNGGGGAGGVVHSSVSAGPYVVLLGIVIAVVGALLQLDPHKR